MQLILGKLTAIRIGFLLLAVSGLTACNGGFPTQDSKFQTPSRHTGALTILRVDDAWAPEPKDRRPHLLGQKFKDGEMPDFVPLRDKNDVIGLDESERIVTKDDKITISLNSAFIKFFREAGGKSASGEVAIILSFDAGSEIKENLLVHSARGQTFGSMLDTTDVPILGPFSIDGDSLLMRIVIVELDQKENEQTAKLVQFLASTATTFIPQAGPVVSIAQPIVDFLVRQNADDVIFDQKFSLMRTEAGRLVQRSPLLYGKYLLVMQEDPLANTKTKTVTPFATLPVVLSDLRYDLKSDRLYKVYSYLPKTNGDPCETPLVDPGELPAALESPLNPGVGVTPLAALQVSERISGPVPFSRKRIDWAAYFPNSPATGQEESALTVEQIRCLLDKVVNKKELTDFRKEQLGFKTPKLSELEPYDSLETALEEVCIEAVRHAPRVKQGEDLVKAFCEVGPKGAYKFNYRVTHYPGAYAFLARYPLHTHLVLSIDRSFGGEGGKYHDKFQDFSEYMENEINSAKDDNRLSVLANVLRDVRSARKAQRRLLTKVNEMKGETKAERVCLLFSRGLTPGKNMDGKSKDPVISDGPIYNELFHITGETFINADDVVRYLETQNYSADASKFTCTEKET